MNNKNFGFGTQIRKSPYFDSTVKWGATGFQFIIICIFQEILEVLNKIFGT